MTTISALRDKMETLRALEAERAFGTVVVPGVALEPIPGLPAGTIEVFSLFTRLEGSHLLFKPPRVIRTPRLWQSRGTDDFPLGESIRIGAEIESRPEYLYSEDEEETVGYGGAPVRLRIADGHVVYIDPDDYIDAYDDPDPSQTPVVTFATDLVTFFDEWVLGEKYPRLVATVLGEETANGMRPRTGEYFDRWRNLLVAAGLSQ